MISIRQMNADDLSAVQDVGQISWSDMASKESGHKVQYPKRSEDLMLAYLKNDPAGCLVAVDGDKVIGSAFCHKWGNIGWIGPLEVLPEYQNQRIGKSLLNACEEYLSGCSVCGLETSPKNEKNMHFYMTAGYAAGQPIIIADKLLLGTDTLMLASEMQSIEDYDIKGMCSKVHPDLDLTGEVEAALNGLGTVYYTSEGFAVLHTYGRGESSSYASVKCLILDPECKKPAQALFNLLSSCETKASELRKDSLMMRFSLEHAELAAILPSMGYSYKAVNIRMACKGDFSENGKYQIISWAG